MRNTNIGLAALAAIAASGMNVVVDTGERMVRAAAPRRVRTTEAPRRRYRIAPSGTSQYPEQSDRQALRGMRRAQGGPGLLRMRDGTYVPRNAVNAI